MRRYIAHTAKSAVCCRHTLFSRAYLMARRFGM